MGKKEMNTVIYFKNVMEKGNLEDHDEHGMIILK
jgi:hypothetical protein